MGFAMSIRKLPDIKNFAAIEGVETAPLEDALNRWNPALRVANAGDGGTVVDIMGYIGKDPYTGEGVGAADIALALKGAGDVTVNINSPGGSLWEGAAIYNLLTAHPGKVTIKNIALAASAASVIMQAGDVRLMAPLSFVMIHNGQVFAAGDRHDLSEVVDTLTTIDAAIRDVYVASTGKHGASISTMMDETTWMNAKTAIQNGFADALLPDSEAVSEDAAVKNSATAQKARVVADAILQSHGLSRGKRRELIGALRNGGESPFNSSDPAVDLSGVKDALSDLRQTIARNGETTRTRDAAAEGMPGAALSRLSAKLDTLN